MNTQVGYYLQTVDAIAPRMIITFFKIVYINLYYHDISKKLLIFFKSNSEKRGSFLLFVSRLHVYFYFSNYM